MAPAPVTENYYKILEVPQTATLEQIVRSYRRLALKLHPDRNASHNATQAFQLVWPLSSPVACSGQILQRVLMTCIVAEQSL